MAIVEGRDLSFLLDSPRTAEEKRHFHAVDITESVWNRMQELGWSQSDLARKLGKNRSQVSRMLSVQGNMTLQTISELEEALGVSLVDTTPYKGRTATATVPVPNEDNTAWYKAMDTIETGNLKVFKGGVAA